MLTTIMFFPVISQSWPTPLLLLPWDHGGCSFIFSLGNGASAVTLWKQNNVPKIFQSINGWSYTTRMWCIPHPRKWAEDGLNPDLISAMRELLSYSRWMAKSYWPTKPSTNVSNKKKLWNQLQLDKLIRKKLGGIFTETRRVTLSPNGSPQPMIQPTH